MLPPGTFISPAGEPLIHPWSAKRTEAYQLGPTAIQDPSQGVLFRMWKAEAVENTVWISSDITAPYAAFTHTKKITDISLAFDQNGNVTLAFMDVEGTSYYYWWDPLIPDYNLSILDGFSPRVTLDDGRPFNVANSDIVLAYSHVGVIRYRLQRDRYSIEYTPLLELTGEPIPAFVMYHVSMNTSLKLAFIYGNTITYSAFNSSQFLAPLIMKQHIVKQKAPAEILPITFDFGHVLAFGDAIVSAAAVITVETGTDPNPAAMLSGAATHTSTTVTQKVIGGITGNVYRIAMSVNTSDSCVYITEGLLYVNDSPGVTPP